VAALGRPAAMKIASPDIAHKTEAGGVALGVASAGEAREAFDRIVARARAYRPGATIDGVEVQEMIPDGVEMLVGLSTDDQLGPVLTVGLGGVLTEVLRDVAQRPVPVSRAEARRMLKELRGATVLDGFRGRPPADVEALIETMLGLSALGEAWRDLRPEVDLNPVIVGAAGEGAVAVDALVNLSPAN
jgi:acetate---CoA ligase (ADP-forming)